MIELKPCPFCGSKAEYYGECYMVKVRCSNYDCECSLVGWFDEPEEAAEDWNRRAGDKAEENQWIPVTERLPEEKINPNTRDFEYVLCTTIWGDVRPFKYGAPIGSTESHFWNGAGYVDAYVTHWMPLPEPPKEET